MILLLIVVAGMQTWYIVGIKKQLNTIQNEQASIQSSTPKSKQRQDQKIETQQPSIAAQPEPQQPETMAEAEQQTAQQSQPVKDPTPHDKQSLSAGESSAIAPYHAQRRDPYREIERMRREMDRAFNNPYAFPYPPPDARNYRPDFQRHFSQNISAPRMNIREDEKQYTVFVDVPGTDAKSLSVDLDGQQLTVKGQQEYTKQEKDASGQILYSERRSGNFSRSVTLPGPVEQKGMQTQIKDDVLKITIPKLR